MAFNCSTVPIGGEIQFKAYVTAYNWWDNTPPGGAISEDVFHGEAGGAGTYENPITMAVGHCIVNGNEILDYQAGTRFYIPFVRKYFIVEDTCGDGPTPQNGPCHTGQDGYRWLDVWINGRTDTSSGHTASADCMDKLTGIHNVIRNPKKGYVVANPGSIYEHGCNTFGETAVLA